MTDNQENTIATKDMSAYPEVDQKEQMQQQEKTHSENNSVYQQLIQRNSR